MRAVRASVASPVALVPTMGALHSGHEALLEMARALGKTVVASLFVNPTQFAEGEDFESYPRDRDRDLAIFKQRGVDAVFAPPVDEMYPSGGSMLVDPGPIGDLLEGRQRPGHFRGVTTIVTKLFALIRPDLAMFGEKDAQQLVVVRHLVRDLMLDVEIVGVPTVREPDGLAFSSRNIYMSAPERRAASVLYRSLSRAEELWNEEERDGEALRSAVRDCVAREPLVELEYVSVADPEDLFELDTAGERAIVSVAARVGRTRLIDSITLTSRADAGEEP